MVGGPLIDGAQPAPQGGVDLGEQPIAATPKVEVLLAPVLPQPARAQLVMPTKE